MKTRGYLHGNNKHFRDDHTLRGTMLLRETHTLRGTDLSEELLNTRKLRWSELHLEQSINSWITNSSTGSLNVYHSDAHAKRALNVLPFHMYIIKCITLSHYSLRAINTLYNPHCKGRNPESKLWDPKWNFL